MRKIKLILGTSNIIPITYNGAENLYQKHFRPFLQLLNKNIDLSFTVYNSGIFYEWLESRHPEFLMLCNDLVKDRNLEILGGAYYEPVFSVIPNKDRVGQIEELTTYLRKKFNRRPRGFWLAEQVWEPNFPSSLATCGMNYLFLDSSFILNAGKKDSELIKCYITEDQGKTIYVFPTHNKLLLKLSQLTPSSAVNKIIEMGNESGNNVIAFIPGGDMFVNNRIKNRISISWFENFLKEIRKKRDQVETIHPSKYLRKYGIFSKVYIPCLNFDEIKKRVVKNSQDRVQKKLDSFFNGSLKELSVGGGFFRDYLSEINESNKLYSKMMFVNVLVNQIRSDRSRKKSAREELWKGQNNYAYWPGSVNGIQNVETRIKAYNSLIEAEKLSREKGIFDSSIMLTDFDMDGQNECIFQGQNINAYIHNFGGCMFELDFLQKPWNYINTFIQDRSRKISRNSDYSFIDYFFSNEENLEDYSKNDIKLFSDFHQSNYTIENFDKEHQEITYRCSGIVKKRNQSWDLIIIKNSNL